MRTEKMLELAYKFRNMIDSGTIDYSVKESVEKTIEDLESELQYKDAKSQGRKGEKTRTSSAKKILKYGISGNNVLEGYHSSADGTVIICNGYMIFDGDPVIGIPETPEPNSYPNFEKVWDIDVVGEFDLSTDDISSIKARLTEGAAETGKRRASAILDSGSTKGVVVWKHSGEVANAFNADYIVWATDLLGGTEWHVKIGAHKKPCIISGERGRALILPIFMKQDPPRIDKEIA